jgi:hypothetical protein
LQASGLWILIGLPVHVAVKVPLLCAWLWQSWREWRSQLNGYRQISGLRIACDGTIEGVDRQGIRRRLRLVGGSFVLAHFAWMRLEFPDRRRYAELLFGPADNYAAWHWLQLVWRQRGRAFGRIE